MRSVPVLEPGRVRDGAESRACVRKHAVSTCHRPLCADEGECNCKREL